MDTVRDTVRTDIRRHRELGMTLRRARLIAGLTQARLGQQLGVTHCAVVQWETGRTAPRRARLASLAAALGLSLPALLGDASEIDLATINIAFDAELLAEAQRTGIDVRASLHAFLCGLVHAARIQRARIADRPDVGLADPPSGPQA